MAFSFRFLAHLRANGKTNTCTKLFEIINRKKLLYWKPRPYKRVCRKIA